MARPADARAWRLPERLTLDTVGRLFAAHAAAPEAISAFDLSAVQQIDSAGVALIHWVRRRQIALGLAPAPVRGDPGRYAELCRAHRLDDAAGCAA